MMKKIFQTVTAVAVLIGAERDEVLLVAGMLQRAQQLGLIEFVSDDGYKDVLQFDLLWSLKGDRK